MKKKILLATIAAACVMGGAAAVAGCNNGGGHSHTYSEEWSYSPTHHYHKCKDESCNSATDMREHQKATRTTATCTEAGVKTTYCTVEGCEWSVEEADAALGHDYDEWTYKDTATHTGVCKNDGCTDKATVAAHRFTSSQVGNFILKTCSDCGVELAEVQINLEKRISETQAEAYTGAELKVALLMAGDGNYTKVYEATADHETGIATLLIQPGVYWVKVTDETNGYLSSDANWIKFDKATAENDGNSRTIILSSHAQYTFKVVYDNDETDIAAGVAVAVSNGYKLNNEPSVLLGEGVTDENGEVTFTLASAKDLVNVNSLYIKISGVDNEYYEAETTQIFYGTANGTAVVKLRPTQRAYTIKVKAEDEFVSGVGVKLTKPEYSDELHELVQVVKAGGTTDENGEFVTDFMPSFTYTLKLELPDEIAASWKLPSNFDYFTREENEYIVNLVGTPTYNLSVGFPSDATCEKSGIKLTVKDTEDNVVAEGTTNEEGKFTAKLEYAEYKVYIDESTLPEGFVVSSAVKTIPSTATLNKQTNSVNYTVADLLEIKDITVTVRSGSRNNYVYYEGVTVKLYQNGELKFTSEQPTSAEGTATIKAADGATYDVVLEGLPANMVCTTASTRISSTTLTATLSPSANFALTIKDKDGNALEGATVSLVTYAYNTRNYYTIAEEVEGVTDASGVVNIEWLTGKTYTVNVVGADGKKYFGQANLTSATQGETVTQELIVYAYDEERPLSGSKAPITYYVGDFVDKEVLVTCSSKRDETFTYGDGTDTIANGTYKFEILNPCGIDYKVITKCGYDENSWGIGVITESNDYMTIEKDENGNIVSVTVNFDVANDASWFNICIGHDVGEGEAATDLFRVLLKITKVA